MGESGRNEPARAAAGVAAGQRRAGGLFDGARRIVLRGRPAAGADPRADRPDLRHRRLPAAVSSRRAARRHGAPGRHAGRAQLRPRRQRLVALLGLQRPGGAPGHAGQSRRGGGDRLRDTGAHLGDPGAARRRAGDDLRPRAAAAHDIGAGHRRMDAQFAHRARQCRRTGLRCRVGGDGAHGLQDAPRLSRPAGHAGGMDRPILGCRRQRAQSPQRRCERQPERAAGPSTSPATAAASPISCRNGGGCRPTPRRSRRGRSRAARS